MCKRLLSALFPCLTFAGQHKGSNELSYQTGSSRSRWTKLFDGTASKDHSTLVLDPRQVSNYSQVQTGCYPSEEFIMSPVQDGKRTGSLGSEEGGAIRKVTRYEVSYDDAPTPHAK